jgi:hypothetical protein
MHIQHQKSSLLDPQHRQATQFQWLQALRTLRIKCRLRVLARSSNDNHLCPSSTASMQTINQDAMALQDVEMEQGKVLTATSALKA